MLGRGAGRAAAAAAFRPRKASINTSVWRSVVPYHLLLGAGVAVTLGQVFRIQQQVASDTRLADGLLPDGVTGALLTAFGPIRRTQNQSDVGDSFGRVATRSRNDDFPYSVR